MIVEQLKDADIEDIEDIIPLIEDSYGFRFSDAETLNVKTFGELCDLVAFKLQHLNYADDCTGQQAFYKLRNSISSAISMDKLIITPDTQLREIFPKTKRRKAIKVIEKKLGFKLGILRPKKVVTALLILIFLSSIIAVGISLCIKDNFLLKIGLEGFIFSLCGTEISNFFANTFDLQTVGEVAEKMSREHYNKSRRNSTTINKREIEDKIQDLFSDKLFISKAALTKDATFI